MFDLHDIAVFRKYLQALKDQLHKAESQVDELRSMIHQMDDNLLSREDVLLDELFEKIKK